jgi:hypothetical protein
MKAMELLSGFVTAPSTTFTAATVLAGNSLTLRNAVEGSPVRLLALWGTHQTAGNIRLRSPQLHDNVQGIRVYDVAANPINLLPDQMNQLLEPQDTLALELTGSATGGDIECASLLVHYEDLPGIEGRFIDSQELFTRTKNIVTVENTLALSTTGQYTGQEALNTEFDLLKANTDYALIGYLVSALCNCIRWQGSDIGNLGIGGPGNPTKKDVTANWFLNLAINYGLPLIPVFNSANKNGILIDGQQDENGTDTTVTSIFAELSPS